MISTKRLASIFILTAILITGGLVISPYAYSSGDDDDDDCDDDDHSRHGDDYDDSSHHSDDDDDDCEPDPCDCKKPDKFTVTYEGPGSELNPAVVEIYKKTDKIGEKDPIVDGITVWNGDNEIVLTASDFGKKKIGSNTGYRILWDDPNDNPDAGLVQIAAIDIHTSCSQELYIGQIFIDGEGDTQVTLTVQDGKRNGKTSIPLSAPLTCEDDQQPTSMASIIVKKALTNDNGGTASAGSYEITLTNVDPTVLPITLVHDDDDPLLNVNEVPAGTYTISEEIVDASVTASYTTVLIAGDTACPSMVDEAFTLKKGKHVTCIIYNDDNFVPGQTGGDGIIFHRGTIEFMYNSINDDDGTLVEVNQIDGTPFDCSLGLTCMSIDDPVMNSRLFTVQDPLINKASSLVVINIYALDMPGNELAFAQKCVVGTLLPGSTASTLDFTFECETHEGIFTVPEGSSLGKYRINYAVIDTLIVSP